MSSKMIFEMLCNGNSEKTEEKTMEVISKLLSEKNTDAVLKNEGFISSLLETLAEMLDYRGLIGYTAEIISKLQSEKNTDAVLKNERFMSSLPEILEKMLDYGDEDSKEKSADIIDGLFSSEKVINIILNEKYFVLELPEMIEKMLL